MPGHGHRSYDVLAPRSKLYQGPFGRICPDLPPWEPDVSEYDLDGYLKEIANDLMTEAPGKTSDEIADDDELREELEAAFRSEVPAGYTYFGQFVDHDITFDPASSLMRANDPNGLINFRTPRLDLDNVYGRGPSEQPYLYDQGDPDMLATDGIEGTDLLDLPRYGNRALIGDMRNDENAMVSQLQLAFLTAHNELVCRAREAGHADPFESARRTLRWLYQHIVWFDFLKTVADEEIWECALRREETCGGAQRWVSDLEHVFSWKHQPFMPVEFSVAAYRFGHSMVRNAYRTNLPHRGLADFAPIFAAGPPSTTDDLRGFEPMEARNAIQWDWFLQMTSSVAPDFPQPARKIDTKLANALLFLPGEEDPLNILAFRNLKRGIRFELPSGTAVARKYCLPVIELENEEPDNLWYYVLKEAAASGGHRLGKLGSTIVCAVFAGLLRGDPCSWINMHPCWKPDDDPLLHDDDKEDDENWGLASIIRISRMPFSAGNMGDPASLRRDEPCKPQEEEKKKGRGKGHGRGYGRRRRHGKLPDRSGLL